MTTTKTTVDAQQYADAIDYAHGLSELKTAAEIESAVDDVEKNKTSTVINGDTSGEPTATTALSVEGQITLSRTETTVDNNRPVWMDMNYFINPSSAPTSLIDYHGLDIFGDVSASSYNVDLSNVNLYLTESKSFYSGNETIKGNYAAFFEAANNGAGTVQNNTACRIWSRNRGVGHVDNLYGIIMTEMENSGTVFSAYGLKIQNIDVGSLNNYAIHTDLGEVYFGDNLEVKGSITTQADSFSSSSTAKDDTSNGRHLRVGDFGVGTPINQNGIDLDSINVSGTISGQNFVNSPTDNWFYIRTTVHNDNYAEQWATGLLGSTKNKIYRRVKDNDVWAAWVELATL